MKKSISVFFVIMIVCLLSACSKDNNVDVQNNEPSESEPIYTVQLEMDSIGNLVFSRYDIDVYLDDDKIGTLEHGETDIFEIELKQGTHTVKVTEEGNTSVDGTATIDVFENVKFSYKLYCHSDQVDIEQEYVESMNPLADGQIKMPESSEEYCSKTYETVLAELGAAGFTNIGAKVIRDQTGGWLEVDGDIEEVSVGGRTEFQKAEVFDKDVEIIITYHTTELTSEEMNALIADKNGVAAAVVLESFEGTNYSLVCSVGGKEIADFNPDGYIFDAGSIDSEKKIAYLSFISEEMIDLQATLEDTFPQENALRAAVVAMTNYQATDVFKSDGNTYDTSKFHSYSDISGFYIDVTDEGKWSAKDDHTWRVNGLIGKLSGYTTYLKVSLDVSFDGTNYVISDVDRVIAAKEYLDSDDPSKTNAEHIDPSENDPCFIVSPALIQEDRDKSAIQEQNDKEAAATAAAEARTRWIENQFSLWDGSHSDLKELIKDNLNDEKSFKHIETTYIDVSDESMQSVVNETLKKSGYTQRVEVGDLLIMTEFSAKNAFNATIKNTAIGIASYENNTITLVGIE